MFSVVGLETLLKRISHDCTVALILELGWLRTSLSMSGFRDKQRTLVNTVGIPGDAGSSPGKSRGNMPKYDPTTKLIILHTPRHPSGTPVA
jgi:hypothetical protein